MSNVVQLRPPHTRSVVVPTQLPMPTPQSSGLTVAELLFGYDEDRAARDWNYMHTNLFIIEGVGARAEEMYSRLFVQSARADYYRVGAAQKRETLMQLSLHDLCGLIMLSERRLWDTLPMYYSALMLEFSARLHQASARAAHTPA